ncbi:MAG: potassium transporter TrkG [Tunicatimonas sp.]
MKENTGEGSDQIILKDKRTGRYKRAAARYRRFRVRNSPQRNLVFGFLLYTFIGFVLLSLPWLQKQPTALLDNLFIATSAISTTGLVTVSVFDSYEWLGQFVVMLLFQIGGVGYLTFTTYYLLTTTKTITHWHERLLKTAFAMPKEIQIQDFLKSVIVFTVAMETLGAIGFFIAFKLEGIETGFALWSSVFHSVSAFCTAGFGLYNDSFMGFRDNLLINIIISVLAITGSLGFIVVTDIWYRIKGKSTTLTFTTKIILYGFLILLGVGTLLVYAYEPEMQGLGGLEKWLASFFQAMTATTTVGFNTSDTGALALPILLFVIFLMYIGASPSGTAGGMKITTLTAVVSLIKSRFRGDKKVTFWGRAIPGERIYVATATFIFYVSLVSVVTFLLTFSEESSFQNILFEAASALGTVGLSAGITGDLSSFGKAVLILTMFVGRLGVVTFGLALLARKRKSDVEFLEDDIAM